MVKFWLTSKSSVIAWIAPSIPPGRPAHSCCDPQAKDASERVIEHMTLPTTRLRVSPTPIGRTPGHLSSSSSSNYSTELKVVCKNTH